MDDEGGIHCVFRYLSQRQKGGDALCILLAHFAETHVNRMLNLPLLSVLERSDSVIIQGWE